MFCYSLQPRVAKLLPKIILLLVSLLHFLTNKAPLLSINRAAINARPGAPARQSLKHRIDLTSHIKPYYVCDKSERANPANGLLLNAFYDRAFDQGLMTVLPDLTIHVSDYVKDGYDDQNTRDWLLGVEGTKIIRPKRFAPNRDMLAYHNEFVFLR